MPEIDVKKISYRSLLEIVQLTDSLVNGTYKATIAGAMNGSAGNTDPLVLAKIFATDKYNQDKINETIAVENKEWKKTFYRIIEDMVNENIQINDRIKREQFAIDFFKAKSAEEIRKLVDQYALMADDKALLDRIKNMEAEYNKRIIALQDEIARLYKRIEDLQEERNAIMNNVFQGTGITKDKQDEFYKEYNKRCAESEPKILSLHKTKYPDLYDNINKLENEKAVKIKELKDKMKLAAKHSASSTGLAVPVLGQFSMKALNSDPSIVALDNKIKNAKSIQTESLNNYRFNAKVRIATKMATEDKYKSVGLQDKATATQFVNKVQENANKIDTLSDGIVKAKVEVVKTENKLDTVKKEMKTELKEHLVESKVYKQKEAVQEVKEQAVTQEASVVNTDTVDVAKEETKVDAKAQTVDTQAQTLDTQAKTVDTQAKTVDTQEHNTLKSEVAVSEDKKELQKESISADKVAAADIEMDDLFDGLDDSAPTIIVDTTPKLK